MATVSPYCPFPSDFLWGVATSAYQIEGAAALDGRGPSVWDTFCQRPGAIALGQTGAEGVDHYHRFETDVALMTRLGVKGYRFSISWSRLFPSGRGQPNFRGLAFYERLVDCLVAAGIQPWATLFHWDLPQALETELGGWESKDCARAFADYAGFVASRLGDRLSGIFTMNEFMCFLDKGYGFDAEAFAPGKTVSRKVLNQSRHHAIYAHGLAVQAIHAASPRPVPIGLAENCPACVPAIETPGAIAAARRAFRSLTGMYLTPIMEGRYPAEYLAQAGPEAPHFTDEEMRVIGSPLDLVGLNLYNPTYIREDPASPSGWKEVACDRAYPRMDMTWLTIGPEILYWAPRFASELWNPKAIYVTENGSANPDRLSAENEVLDPARAMYLRQHLQAAHRAVTEGVPLKGYFAWSLMDNFEWAFGYTKRFGLCYTHFPTLERIPKLSAQVYSQIIRDNALGPAR